MQINNKPSPAQKRTTAFFYLGFIVIVFILGLIFLYQKFPNLWETLSDQQKIRSFISGYGVRAPLILVGLQVLQIIFAPLPGHFIAFSSGYLLGVVKGTLLSLLGITIGCTLTFWISRFFGRQTLLNFISNDKMSKFDEYILHKGPFILFVLLLIPFSPLGDVIYYLAGLTPIPFFVFLLMVIIARLPSNIINNLIGAKAVTFTKQDWLVFLAIIIIFASLFYLFRRQIERLILRFVKLDTK